MSINSRLKSLFSRNKAVSAAVFCGLAINLTDWIIIAKNEVSANIPIPLHYNAYYGVDYLGDYKKIFVIPAVGLIIIFANIILSFLLAKKCKFASQLLIFIIPFIQILLMVATISIVLFNL